MSHQSVALRKAWPLREFALFHEMGTGKTYEAINLAAARYIAGQIDACVIFCPSAIKDVWHNEYEHADPDDECEIKKFCPVDYSVWVFESGDHPANWSREKRAELKFLIISVESMSIENGQSMQALKYFLRFHRTMAVIDESSRIKNWKAQRTINMTDVGGLCDYRLIMTGTSITQGLEDLFGQFNFLNNNIVGCKNFFIFRNKYCVMGGFKNKQVLGYQFKNHLFDKLKPYCHIALKKDCLDLPDKVYPGPILVKPTENQRRVMKDLATTYSMQDGNEEIEVSTVLERMTRYQQVIGGTFPFEIEGEYHTKPIPGGNPKINALMEWVQGLPQGSKAIIWARFVPEIKYITAALKEEYGEESVVQFYGGNKDTRGEDAARFKSEPQIRFMVSNQAVGGYGQTWVVATFVFYYSNSFSYEDRRQSEDRSHRKGQHNKVTYQDCEMEVKQDLMILKAVRRKHDLAMEVQGALQ